MTTISSPGSQVFAIAREMSNVSWVMLRPKTTPSGAPPTRSASAVLAASTVSSALRSAGVSRPRFESGWVIALPHRLAHDVRGLRATRPVEVRRASGEAGEVRAQRLDVVPVLWHVADPATLSR